MSLSSYGNERSIRIPATNQVDKDPPPRVQYIARRYAASGFELDTAGGGGGKSKNADTGFCMGCDCVGEFLVVLFLILVASSSVEAEGSTFITVLVGDGEEEGILNK